MRKIVYITILLFCFSFSLTAQKKYIYQDSSLNEQQAESPSVEEQQDEQYVQSPVVEQGGPDTTLYFYAHSLPADSVKKWSKARGLEYMAYIDSLLKAKRKENKQPDNQPRFEAREPGFLSSIFASGIFEVIMWILAGGFVLFILYRLFLTQGIFKRTVKARETAEPEVTEEGEITQPAELDMKIRQAEAEGNFRLAVRYQYLKALHRLAEQERVELAADKTNYQYVRELKDYNQQNEFAALTLNYEYVWYGEFLIGKDIYDRIAEGFKAFGRKW
jgi:hypothetical protein